VGSQPAQGETPIKRLDALGADPEAQRAFALELLDRPAATFDVQAALRTLARLPDPGNAARLHALYEYLDVDGVKRDSAGFLRAEILRALRPIVGAADVPLLQRAAMTVEYLPPGRQEVCSPLRAAALIVMVDVDLELAALNAVRLLHDEHVDLMAGEPALTAARVLAAIEQPSPLYAYVLGGHARVPEVTAECLRNLVGLPQPLVADLAARFPVGAANPAELAGVAELLMGHKARDSFTGQIESLLATEDMDLLTYLATLGLNEGEAMASVVLHAARWETNPHRAAVFLAALDARATDPAVADVREALARRLGR
jgi:hypothetical protein